MREKNYQQTDIISAIRGKDKILEDDESDIVEKKKSLSPFDFAKDILFFKKGNLMDTEEGEKAFNPYMVLKILSMHDDIHDDVILFSALFDKYQQVLNKKQLYMGLVSTISQRRIDFKPFIKQKNEKHEIAEHVANYFKCSIKQASEYINIMGQDWVNTFKAKFGDFIEEGK